MILSEHLVKCDTDDRPFDTYWYKYTVGRLQQVFLAVSIIFHFLYIFQSSHNKLNAVTFLLRFFMKVQL